jgi:hypothetical protein
MFSTPARRRRIAIVTGLVLIVAATVWAPTSIFSALTSGSDYPLPPPVPETQIASHSASSTMDFERLGLAALADDGLEEGNRFRIDDVEHRVEDFITQLSIADPSLLEYPSLEDPLLQGSPLAGALDAGRYLDGLGFLHPDHFLVSEASYRSSDFAAGGLPLLARRAGFGASAAGGGASVPGGAPGQEPSRGSRDDNVANRDRGTNAEPGEPQTVDGPPGPPMDSGSTPKGSEVHIELEPGVPDAPVARGRGHQVEGPSKPSSDPAPVPVPEPATLTLALLGTAALAASRRRALERQRLRSGKLPASRA